MRNLQHTLKDSDPALLPILARVWGTRLDATMNTEESAEVLAKAMLDTEKAERIWTSMSDDERRALQTLIGSSGAKMKANQFKMIFGALEKKGSAQIERERPDQRGTIAEKLYYKGLIAEGFENAATGAQPVIYVPGDLLRVLPVHKTAYENLEDEPEGLYDEEDEDEAEPPDAAVGVEPLEHVESIRAADTSIVDDMTTLLAYLQLYSAGLARTDVIADFSLIEDDRRNIFHTLLLPSDDRLDFLLGLALSAELVDVQNGRLYPKRAEVRRWLAATRAEQVKSLAEAWRESRLYRDLWHVPGLYPEPGGELDSYDAAAVRGVIAGFMADLVPKNEWWSVSDFIDAVKETDPDFQRPGGNYESWYIRNEDSEYLQGFESWDAIEGALLEFLLYGPMHWLGLVDTGQDASRLTAYGRAFLNLGPWPTPPDPQDKVVVKEDGTLLVSRKVTRIDRFQVARFATWGAAGDPYTYKLDARGISKAAEQGINTGHISAFISRALGDNVPIPPAIARLLDNWQKGPAAEVTLERLLVLRTNSPEVMQKIWDTPAFRRYLGARLGEMAVIARADTWEALRDALGEAGIQVEIMG